MMPNHDISPLRALSSGELDDACRRAQANDAEAFLQLCEYFHAHASEPKHRQYAQAFCERAAELGDVRANIILGHALVNHHRYRDAERCFRAAAEAGYTGGMWRLAGVLLFSHSRTDTAEALAWLREAGRLGDPIAATALETFLDGIEAASADRLMAATAEAAN